MSRANVYDEMHEGNFTNAGQLFPLPVSGGYLFAWGVTVPSAVAGYAPGCIFIDINASGESLFLVNTGTADSCTFTSYEIGLQDALLSIANAKGASMVGIEDSGTFTTAATVEAALAEIYQHIATEQAFIPVPLTTFRELAAGVTQNLAAHGGILAVDSTPILSTVADGDALRITWDTGNVDEIAAPVLLPPDLDASADVIIHLLASKNTNTNDTIHLDGEFYQGEGDADCFPAVGASNLLDAAAKEEYTATIANTNIAAGAVNANCTLLLMPEAHANDLVFLHGVWLEYTRKILTA